MSKDKGGRSSKVTPQEFEDLLKGIQNILKETADEARRTKDISDARKEELAKIFKEHNEKIIRNLKENSKKLEEEIKSNPELQSFIETFRTKVNEEVEKLKTANSENMGKSLQNSWNSITDQMTKSYKEIQQKGRSEEELEKYFESLLNKMKQSVQELESKIQEFQKAKKNEK